MIAGREAYLDSHAFFELGEPIDRLTFPEIVERRLGQGPLQLLHKATPTGSLLASLGFRDAVRDVPCITSRFCDGSLRCVPRALPFEGYYADAACTTPAILVEPQPRDAAVFVDVASARCPQGHGDVWELATEDVGLLHVRQDHGRCAPAETGALMGRHAYVLDHVLDRGDFPELVEGVE